MADIFGWIGNALFILGAIMLARKDKSGFVFNGLGNVLYVVYAILLNTTSLTVLSVFLVGVNLYGYYNWKRT